MAAATARPTPNPVPPRNPATQPPPDQYPRQPTSVLEAQIALARHGISCGPMDGVVGSQTRAALRAYQEAENLPVTGQLDAVTREHLLLEEPPLTQYTVTTNDIARLLPLEHTWLGKSNQERLDYETILELVAEKSWSHPALVKRLNPGVDWNRVQAGRSLELPATTPLAPRARAASVHIRLAAKSLAVYDEQGGLLAYFPCSIARQVEKRPVGELHIAAVAFDPNYTFNPEVFPESPEARELGRKLILPPGPNNPVGLAWIGLDRPGYGIHGTPGPEEVGRTESHGCFRLANWNVVYLARMATIGMPVIVEP